MGRDYSPHLCVSPAGDGSVASIADTRSLVVSSLPHGEIRWMIAAANASCADWTLDGTALAAGAVDGSVTVRDPLTGAELCSWDAHGPSGVRAIAWGVGDRILATTGADDGCVKLWFMDARRPFGLPRLLHEMRSADGAQTTAVAWSAAGVLAAAGIDTIVRLWRVKGGLDLAAEMKGHSGPVTDLAWSPDGVRLASCSFDKTLWIWDMATSSGVLAASNVCDPMVSVAWSPDGESLAYGADGYRIGLINTQSLEQAFLPGHANAILCLDWAGSRSLLSSSLDRRTSVWDTSESRAGAGGVERHTTPVGGASAFSHDGSRAASADYGLSALDGIVGVEREHPCSLIIRRTSDGSSIPGEHQGYAFRGVTGLAWSHDDARIALCCRDGSAAIIDADSGRGLERWLASAAPCVTIAWSPDDQLVAIGSADGIIRTWQPLSEKPALNECGTTAPVWSLAWSPDGSSLVAGMGDGSTARYDSRLRKLWSAHNHAGSVYAVAWCGPGDGGSTLATCGADGQVIVCDAESGEPLISHRSPWGIYATEGLGAGLLCSVGDGGVLDAWSPATGESVALLYLPSGASRLRVVGGSRVLVGLLQNNALVTYDFEFIMPAAWIPASNVGAESRGAPPKELT